MNELSEVICKLFVVHKCINSQLNMYFYQKLKQLMIVYKDRENEYKFELFKIFFPLKLQIQ